MAIWREREGAGEVESKRMKVKSKNAGYLQHQWVTEELVDTSALSLGCRSSGATSDSGELRWWSEKREEDGGSSSGFIGGTGRCVDGRGVGRM